MHSDNATEPYLRERAGERHEVGEDVILQRLADEEVLERLAHQRDDLVSAAHCPAGPEPPFLAVKRPYKSAIQNHIAMGNAKAR